MIQEQDHYQVLGITRDAIPEEIRRAYFDAARRLHPDANPDPTAAEQFIEIQKAYEILSNPDKRYDYDKTLPEEDTEPGITVNVQYSTSAISRMTEAQVAYVLLEIKCQKEPDRAKLPALNICLVIDRSTSMKGERMDMIKTNIEQMLRRLAPKDIVSIVAFSDRAEVVIPPTRVMDVASLSGRISMIDPGGGTEIYQGLEMGMNLLRLRGSASFTRHLVLITDGHTYGDEQICIDLAKQAAVDGVVVSALGIGHEWNDSFLDNLSGQSGGSTMFINSSSDLQKFIETKILTLNQVYARRLSYEFDTGNLVKPRYAFRLQPEVGPLPITSPMMMGNLQYGASQIVLFELIIQELPREMEYLQISSGRLRMESAIDGKLMRYPLNFRRTVSPSIDPELPPPIIVDAMSRLTLYRLQERARQEVDAGDVSQATKHLQYLATHLLSQGDRDLAHTVLVEAEHIQQSHRFSRDGDKRIKYGTRALLLPANTEQKEE